MCRACDSLVGDVKCEIDISLKQERGLFLNFIL
jgi:hypothetical protein